MGRARTKKFAVREGLFRQDADVHRVAVAAYGCRALDARAAAQLGRRASPQKVCGIKP